MSLPRVAIYIDENFWAGMAMLVKEGFAIAGTLHARNPDLAQSRLFDVALVAASRAPVPSFTGPALQPEASIHEFARPEVIVVCPQFHASNEPHVLPPDVRQWLRDAYAHGAILVSMASGVRTLAETGLLDGHEVTGNPSDRAAFASHYPQIRFTPETPLIIDGRIVSAATIDPCLDALAYLLHHFHGEAAAAKFTRYTTPRVIPTALAAAPDFASYRQHQDARVRQAQEYLERHFAKDISVAEVARRVAMSERNFSRRFRAALGMSPLDYLQRCRVEGAKTLLRTPGTSVLQAALQSGFSDAPHLRRVFRQATGMTPQDWRQSGAA